MSNIYLIGMMGSGKTVTGKSLASKMGKDFEDLDLRLEQKLQMTIPQVFQKHGESYFRIQEAGILREIKPDQDLIVSTGGGIILNPQNVVWMKETGTVVYLETSFEFLWKRVEQNKNRPLLHGDNPEEKMKTIFAERKPLYENASDLKVATDGLDADTVAENILRELEVSQ